jgi:nitroreductase/NAD-dependent dihydropyrimidine dehydrogenase PreA subunit
VTPSITFKESQCIKCGVCVQTCPMGVYQQKAPDHVPEVIDAAACIACGHCVAVCPEEAIDHPVFPGDKVGKINKSILPPAEGVSEFLKTRRSVRLFQDKPVEKEIVQKIIQAAQTAPSAHNKQTTRYMAVQDKKVLADIVKAATAQYNKIVSQLKNPLVRSLVLAVMRNQAQSIKEMTPAMEKLTQKLNAGIDEILHHAPVLLLFHADGRQLFADTNAQLSCQNAALAAHSLGLGGFYTGYLQAACQRDKSIGRLVHLPEHHKIYAGLAMGYPKYQYHQWVIRKPAEIKWV